jgi:hypothetical protein
VVKICGAQREVNVAQAKKPTTIRATIIDGDQVGR